jgi:Retrotransposon gag protein
MAKDELAVNKPLAFDGDYADYQSFCSSLTIYFMSATTEPTPYQKITTVLSYMVKGEALAWRNYFLKTNSTTAIKALSFEEFELQLDKQFKDPMHAQKAMDQLSSIRQGKKDTDAFTVEFDTLVSLAGYTDDAAILNLYQRALNGPLVDSIFRGDLPLGYQAWKKKACLLDQQFHQRQEQKKHFSAHAPKLSQKAPRDPNAMDVDQTSTTSTRPKFTKLTDAQRTALIANKGCFRCRTPAAGHTARDCPLGKKPIRIRATEDEPSDSRQLPPPPPPWATTSTQ